MDNKQFNTYLSDLHSMEELLENIRLKYEKLENQNKYLKEENEKLKNDVWKDEEMARMKKEYEQMKEDYYRGFPISKEESEKIQAFKNAHNIGRSGMYKIDAAGTRFHYEFYPTPLGVSGIIKCTDGSELQFQELG